MNNYLYITFVLEIPKHLTEKNRNFDRLLSETNNSIKKFNSSKMMTNKQIGKQIFTH